MSNRKRVRAWQEAQRRETALTTPRHFRESISLTGIGIRELQLARVPSFERTEVWDLHRDPETQSLRLYTARSAGPDSDHVVGCEEVDVDSAMLEDIVRRFRDADAPLAGPGLDTYDIADGTDLEVSFHGIRSNCSFRWCEGEGPETWLSLEALVHEALEIFRDRPRRAV